MVAAVHVVVRWQVSHEAVVTRWFDRLPLAFVPLWQVAQVPGVTLPWLMVAFDQLVVRWQVSQVAVVMM
jgi:P2-related tail formation protein